jgi:2,5-diketo-D-gluconate reductase A
MPFDPTAVPAVRLNDGSDVPQFGFGVFQIPADQTVTAVRTALDAGYRHIDTAQMYGNEAEVGRAIAESGVPREEIFVTTKLDNSRHGYDAALGALDESLRRLRFDHVDLFLIHWPRPQEGRYVETWTALEKLKAGRQGHVHRGLQLHGRTPGPARRSDGHRARGEPDRAAPAVPAGGTARLPRRARHRDGGVEPDRPGRRAAAGRQAPRARRRARPSPAQVVLRWHIQLGNIVFPKSVTPERIR